MDDPAALIVSIATLVTSLTGMIALFRRQGQTKILMNSHLTALTKRIEQLTALLSAAGIDIPDVPPKG